MALVNFLRGVPSGQVLAGGVLIDGPSEVV